MIAHYLASAMRHFRRNKLTTSINFACLTLGLSCFVLAYGVHSYYKQSDARFPDAERTYFISQTFQMSDTGASAKLNALPWKAAPLLKVDFPELSMVARAGGELSVQLEMDGGRIPVRMAGADPEFLRIFPLKFRDGNADEALQRPGTAVISEAIAKKLFGTVAATGRTLRLPGGSALEVTGVVQLPPPPSHLGEETLQVLVPIDTFRVVFAEITDAERARSLSETWQLSHFRTYVVLAPESWLDARTLNQLLPAFATRHLPPSRIKRIFHAEHISAIGTARLSAAEGSLTYLSLLLALAVLVLTIACLNYSILALAQSRSRLRELGIHWIVGAARRQLIQQHLIEAAIVALAAFASACAVALLLTPVLETKADIHLLPILTGSPGFWAGSFGAAFAVVLLSSSYPALSLARRRPVDTLRNGAPARRPVPTGSVLVGTQFAVVMVLLIGVFVVSDQNERLLQAASNTGTEPIVVISNSLQTADVSPNTLKTELERLPHVRSVAYSALPPWSGTYSMSCCLAREGSAGTFSVLNSTISAEYFDTLGIHLLAGRTFDATRVSDIYDGSAALNRVVIDQGSAIALGWSNIDAAIGKQLYAPRDEDSGPQRYEIIGVVEDRLFQTTGPSSALRAYWLSPLNRAVTYIRISTADIPTALRNIDASWQALAPHSPIERRFLDEMFEDHFRQFTRNARIVSGLTVLAFAIALSGLIAMALHASLTRHKEIGVRKALGATVAQIVLMLMRDFSRPIVLASVIAWPVAYVAARKYLGVFVQSVDLGWMPFVVSSVVVLMVSWAAVVAQALSAARIRPASVLRCD